MVACSGKGEIVPTNGFSSPNLVRRLLKMERHNLKGIRLLASFNRVI
jgi:hypothetical protein